MKSQQLIRSPEFLARVCGSISATSREPAIEPASCSSGRSRGIGRHDRPALVHYLNAVASWSELPRRCCAGANPDRVALGCTRPLQQSDVAGRHRLRCQPRSILHGLRIIDDLAADLDHDIAALLQIGMIYAADAIHADRSDHWPSESRSFVLPAGCVCAQPQCLSPSASRPKPHLYMPARACASRSCSIAIPHCETPLAPCHRLGVAMPLHAGDGSSPAQDLEHALHPWVAFGVLPAFAFANAGLSLTGIALSDLMHPIQLGIGLGLLVGKQLGVLGSIWLATPPSSRYFPSCLAREGPAVSPREARKSALLAAGPFENPVSPVRASLRRLPLWHRIYNKSAHGLAGLSGRRL